MVPAQTLPAVLKSPVNGGVIAGRLEPFHRRPAALPSNAFDMRALAAVVGGLGPVVRLVPNVPNAGLIATAFTSLTHPSAAGPD